MAALADTLSASVWVTTATIGYVRPFGMASDSTHLYVSCWGDNGADGAVVKIDLATKAVTAIHTGLQFPKGTLHIDSGLLYYTTAPNGYGTSNTEKSTIWRYDGSSSTILTNSYQGNWTFAPDSSINRLYGIDRFSFQIKNPGNHNEWLQHLNLSTGARTWTQDTGGTMRNNESMRSMQLVGGELYTTSRGESLVYRIDKTTGATSATFGSTNVTGLDTWSATDAYTLSKTGVVRRANLTAMTQGATITTTGMPTADGYGQIHFTSTGRCFVTRGNISSGTSSPTPNDTALATGSGHDVGIYELVTTLGRRPVVGYVGFGLS